MNKRARILLLATVTLTVPLFSQVAKDLKVTVEEIQAFMEPDVLQNTQLKSLPAEEEWIQSPSYLWFVNKRGVSKRGNFPAGCQTEIEKLPGGVLKIKNGPHVFEKKVMDNLEEVLASPDGSMLMFLYSEVFGDISRYTVWLLDLVTGKEDKITNDPVGFAEFSPNSKYIITEGLHLIDAKVNGNERTEISLGEFSYPELLGWSKDGRKLIFISYENWEGPKYAKKYLAHLR